MTTNRDRYRSVFRPGLFDGHTVVVTGGGSGLGRCTAHELASLGARLALVGRKLDKLERVCTEIAEDGGRVTGVLPLFAKGGRTPQLFSAPGGLATKLRLLQMEGAQFGEQAGLF